MKNSFTVEFDNDSISFFSCCVSKCDPNPSSCPDSFYSYKHAIANGWEYHGYVGGSTKWICPDCAKTPKNGS